MEPNWAAEHLQVIRTLMERSAVYRRALAPIMTFIGIIGIVAGIGGWLLKPGSNRSFIIFWAIVAAIAMVGSYLLVRRQALRAAEPFWTPPTRRITIAVAPPLLLGALAAVMLFNSSTLAGEALLPPVWMSLYGCSLHSAGFFTPRGIRVLGRVFVLVGAVLLLLTHCLAKDSPLSSAMPNGNLLMALAFGGLHLAAGIYLYFTEKHRDEM
jgi:hypothetical protein